MINKPVFSEVFGKMKQDEIVSIATRIGKNEVRDIALFMKGRMEPVSFMSWFETRMINSSVQVSHTNIDGFHTYVMMHDIGRHWSVYLKTILELIFSEVFGMKISVKADRNTISFNFSD